MRLGGIAIRIEPGDRERRLLPLLREQATNAMAWAAVNDPVCFYIGERVDGIVPFVTRGDVAMGLGGPICAPDVQAPLGDEFRSYCAERGLAAIHFPLDAPTAEAMRMAGYGVQHAGLEPCLDLDHDHLAGRRGIRQALTRAEQADIQVDHVPPDEIRPQTFLDCIRDLYEEWLSFRGQDPSNFAFKIDPLAGHQDKRFFVAYEDDEPVAFLDCVPVQLRDRWVVTNLCRLPDAPEGTTEALIHSALEALSEMGAGTLSLGPVFPAFEAGRELQEHPFLRRVIRRLFEDPPGTTHYGNVLAYKQKFHPDRLEACYLAFHPSPLGASRFVRVLEFLMDREDYLALAARAETLGPELRDLADALRERTHEEETREPGP